MVNQATNDGIYDWDVKNDLFTWGDGFYRNFGYKKSKKAFRLSDWINLTHPNDAEKNKEAWDSFLQNQMETKWSKKFRFRKADGQYAFVEEIGILIRDKNGDPHRMIGALRDQTEMQQKNIQKQIERELGIIFKNGENLSEILNDVLTYILDFTNSITAEVWLVGSQEKQLNFIANVANDENGREFYKLCKNVTTLKPGEGLPGKVWESGNIQIWENVHENRIFIRQKAAKAAGLTSFVGIPLNHNQKIIGSIILGGKKNATNEENNVLLLKPLGHFLGAEIARKQQEEELNHLFHSSPDIIAIATPSGHFSKVNPAFCNLLGYSEVELTSTPFKEFLHPDDIETTKKEYKETVSGGRLANNFINRYRTKSGNYKWISWSSSGIFGEEKFVFAFGRDITKVKELEQLFDSAAKLARIGSWELDMRNKEKHAMYWSPMTKKILEADDNEIPSLTGGFDLYATESKVLIEHSINKLIEEGIKFDHELLLTTFKGNERWVRCIGDSERVNGQCIRIYGSFQDIHNRKIAELELLKFKKIIEHSKDGIAIADHNGKSIYLNSGFSEMLGYTAAEINTIGGPMNVYADKETANDVFSTLLSGEYWKGDIKILNSKGEAIDFYLSGGGIFDEGGKLIAIYGIHTDISDRKNAEIALQKAFEERNSILESIGDGFLAVDRNFEITYFNHRAEAILGKKRIEVIGRNLWEVYEDAVELEFFNQYNHALQTGQTVIFESFYPSLNIWFEVSVYPSEKGLSIFFKDVTIRKTAEEQIRQSNERFEMVSAATNDAIWDYDIVNDTLFWGEGFKTLFGHDSNKVMPTLNSWTEHMHPQEKENVYTSFLNAIKSKDQTTWSAEYRYKNESGEYVYVNDRGIIVRDENGNPVRAIGAMSDITYRKSYEASLKNLNIELENRAKDLEITNAELEQFAYVASHDLQEPLRMVTSFLSQLEKKYKDHLDERAHQYIYFAVDGAKRMRQVILDLLQYSRVGRMEEDKETINLNTLIDDYCIMRNTLIEEKSATILKSNLPVITSHKSQVTQIFHNLLDNALKYTKTGVNAEISIDCNENETHWEFSVRDNGIGIDAEYFDKIFVIFQRLHDIESYSGTGIGLAIVKKIVENLDGKIRIESEKDKGSIFYFTIKK